MNRKYIFIWIVLGLLLLGFIYSLNKEKKDNPVLDVGRNDETTIDLGNGIKAVGKGDFKVEEVKQTSTNTIDYKKYPNLNVPINFSGDINDETKQLLISKIEETKSKIVTNPSSLSLWLDLGMYFKIAGDFNNAKIYWEHLLKLSPNDVTTLSNLADLYAFYLKDSKIAITYYKKAIENSPKSAELYVKLADVYFTVLSDKENAISVIDQGLKVLPDSQLLKQTRDNLSK